MCQPIISIRGRKWLQMPTPKQKNLVYTPWQGPWCSLHTTSKHVTIPACNYPTSTSSVCHGTAKVAVSRMIHHPTLPPDITSKNANCYDRYAVVDSVLTCSSCEMQLMQGICKACMATTQCRQTVPVGALSWLPTAALLSSAHAQTLAGYTCMVLILATL